MSLRLYIVLYHRAYNPKQGPNAIQLSFLGLMRSSCEIPRGKKVMKLGSSPDQSHLTDYNAVYLKYSTITIKAFRSRVLTPKGDYIFQETIVFCAAF